MPELPPLGGGEVAHEAIELLQMDENEEESSEDSLLSDEKSVQSFSASLSDDHVSLYINFAWKQTHQITCIQFRPSEDLMLEADEQINKKRKKSASDRQLKAFKACFGPTLSKVSKSASTCGVLNKHDLKQFKEFARKMLENCPDSKIQMHKKERLRYVLEQPGMTSALSIWCVSVKAFYSEAPRGEGGKKKRYKSTKVSD